jgi:hypothetical protein
MTALNPFMRRADRQPTGLFRDGYEIAEYMPLLGQPGSLGHDRRAYFYGLRHHDSYSLNALITYRAWSPYGHFWFMAASPEDFEEIVKFAANATLPIAWTYVDGHITDGDRRLACSETWGVPITQDGRIGELRDAVEAFTVQWPWRLDHHPVPPTRSKTYLMRGHGVAGPVGRLP